MKGAAKEAAGRLSGKRTLQVKGKVEKLVGKAQTRVGQAEDRVGQAEDRVVAERRRAETVELDTDRVEGDL